MSTLFIETDLEPDDVLALYLLPKANYYVVGEGDPNIKYNRMKQYCQSLNNTSATVVQGFGSKKPFHGDGKEFDNLPQETCNEDYLSNFIKFAKSDNPVMFCLKPMRELLAEYTKDKKLVSSLVKNITLYVYGGFNFRCVLKEHENNLLELLNAFKKVCIYESYYASGQQNSMNKQNSPLIYKYFMENLQDPYINTLMRLTSLWNNHLRDEMIEDLKTEENKDIAMRSQKVIDSITGNEDFQYVVADFGLACVYNNSEITPMPISNLRFENYYTKFDEASGPTNIYVYKDIPFEKLNDMILKLLQRKIELVY